MVANLKHGFFAFGLLLVSCNAVAELKFASTLEDYNNVAEEVVNNEIASLEAELKTKEEQLKTKKSVVKEQLKKCINSNAETEIDNDNTPKRDANSVIQPCVPTYQLFTKERDDKNGEIKAIKDRIAQLGDLLKKGKNSQKK